jgi:hypothetical protein
LGLFFLPRSPPSLPLSSWPRHAAYIEARNTFPLPEIIFDPSLILSPHVALLGLVFADNAFLAPSLTSAARISELDIPLGYEQLPLHLKPEMADILVFRKSVRTPYGWEISPDQPLPYTTLLKWMKRLGVLTGFPQITRPYCLRYGAGNAFNQSGASHAAPFLHPRPYPQCDMLTVD